MKCEDVQRLQSPEFNFKLLVDSVKDYAIFMLDPEGYILSWNEGAQRIKGYPEKEILGKHFSLFYTDDDLRRGRPQEVLELASRLGKFEDRGWRRRRDGTLFWAHVTVCPIRNESGVLIGYGKVTRDLTEQKERDEELRQWKDLIVHAHWGMAISNPDASRFLRMNEAYARMHGYTIEELMKRPVLEVFAPHERPKFQEFLRSGAEQGHVAVRSEHMRRDGSVFPVLIELTTVSDPNGKPAYRAANVHDLTEIENAERALIESRELLEQSQLVGRLGHWSWDLAKNELRCSKEVCRIMGDPSVDQQMSYEKFLSSVHPDDRARVELAIHEALYENRPCDIDHRILRADGSHAFVHQAATVLFDRQSGRPLRMFGTMQDVTERKRFEIQLQESERLLKTVIEILPVGVSVTNEEGAVLLWNFANYQIFGRAKPGRKLTPEELPLAWEYHSGKSIQPDDWPDERARRFGEPCLGELLRIRCPGGREKIVVISSVPIRNPQGSIRGAVTIYEDVTSSKRADLQERFLSHVTKSLSESLDYQTTLRKIAQSAVPEICDWAAVYIQDGQGFPFKAFAHRDPEKEPLLEQISELPFNPHSAYGLVSVLRNRRPVVVSEMTDAIYRSMAFTDRHQELYNQLSIESYAIIPILVREKSYGALLFGCGSSGRRLVEDDVWLLSELAVRAGNAIENAYLYREAQDAVRTREDVLAIVSHDLKNPLSAISIRAQMLERAAGNCDPRKAHEFSIGIQRSVSQMLSLISDLLDFARVSAGKLVINPTPCDLRTLIEEHLDSVAALAQKKSIRIENSFEPRPYWGYCDPHRIQQVVSNIVGNAIKFTQPGGRVSIGATETEREVVIYISDNGPGMLPETAHRVFDKYWQPRESSHQGSGLGLSIAKGIIESHGGRIGVDSKPGEGSTFWFSIPKPHRKSEGRPAA